MSTIAKNIIIAWKWLITIGVVFELAQMRDFGDNRLGLRRAASLRWTALCRLADMHAEDDEADAVAAMQAEQEAKR